MRVPSVQDVFLGWLHRYVPHNKTAFFAIPSLDANAHGKKSVGTCARRIALMHDSCSFLEFLDEHVYYRRILVTSPVDTQILAQIRQYGCLLVDVNEQL